VENFRKSLRRKNGRSTEKSEQTLGGISAMEASIDFLGKVNHVCLGENIKLGLQDFLLRVDLQGRRTSRKDQRLWTTEKSREKNTPPKQHITSRSRCATDSSQK
jgi:uncharacterized protein (UPF0218 family)